jgi:hypothetical protein
MRETKKIRMTQRGSLLLGGVRDRAHPPSKPKIRRSIDARLKRSAPSLVSELHLFDRDPGIAAHHRPPSSGVTVMMWSAIRRGAGVRDDTLSRSRGNSPSCSPYAGDASDISARSTSDRRTRHSRPTRTARRRPPLIQARTVAGWIFNSAPTCCTVSHGSSPGTGRLEMLSAIQHFDARTRRIYHLGTHERS